ASGTMAASSSRSSSPGATRGRWLLLAELVLERRPALAHLIEEALGIGGEGVAIGFPAEQIEPLRRNHEEAGIAGGGHAAGDIGRIVAAELRPVDLGMGQEGGPVALVPKAPDGAPQVRLELRRALFGAATDEIGHGIEALDGHAAETVDDDPLGGGRLRRQPRADDPNARQQADQE